MNRELLISDLRRFQRLYKPQELPEKIADYISETFRQRPQRPYLPLVNKDKVIGLVCQHFKVSLLDLIPLNRSATVKYKRQVLTYLLSTRTGMNDTDIGNMIHRHRTTILSSCRRILYLMDNHENIEQEIALLNSQL